MTIRGGSDSCLLLLSLGCHLAKVHLHPSFQLDMARTRPHLRFQLLSSYNGLTLGNVVSKFLMLGGKGATVAILNKGGQSRQQTQPGWRREGVELIFMWVGGGGVILSNTKMDARKPRLGSWRARSARRTNKKCGERQFQDLQATRSPPANTLVSSRCHAIIPCGAVGVGILTVRPSRCR